MAVSTSDPRSSDNNVSGSAAAIPKRITNAQTVCNERNEKNKLCNGHLKQLRTAGEPAEVHLRGDDVLFKCQTCGTLYMGPPLGHVRDPGKQRRFVEAELTALLQAAGGTLPVVKKDERGVFVLVETATGDTHGAKPAPAKPAAAPAAEQKAPAASAAPPAAAKPAAPKGPAQPDRTLMRRYTYAGVTDTGPVAGETFQQKVERLKALAAAAKRRADEGGAAEPAHKQAAPAIEATPPAPPAAATVSPPPQDTPAPAQSAAPAASGSGPDRTLMRRSTYAGVVDTGPVPGETFAQKVERLRALAAAAKQRAEGG